MNRVLRQCRSQRQADKSRRRVNEERGAGTHSEKLANGIRNWFSSQEVRGPYAQQAIEEAWRLVKTGRPRPNLKPGNRTWGSIREVTRPEGKIPEDEALTNFLGEWLTDWLLAAEPDEIWIAALDKLLDELESSQ